MWVFALMLSVALSFAARSYQVYEIDKAEDYFEDFMKTYNKQYADEIEKLKRLEIFKENLEIINQKNAESDSAVYGITMFTDLTSEEVIENYTGLHGFNASYCDTQYPVYKTAPDAFDWREQNVVTVAKNQLTCGSCWAFSAVGNLESQYAIKYKQMLDLSEQQLVDCDTNSNGCKGSPDLAYPFLYWTDHGPMPEKDYPYEDATASCRADDSRAKPKISGCVAYSTQDEEALKQALHDVGPLTFGLDSTDVSHYQNGVLHKCRGEKYNHAVLLVGYGTEGGIPFWVVKNSWGPTWGEQGFFKIKRGQNACGMMGHPMVTAVLA